jgi:hypothetical protein
MCALYIMVCELLTKFVLFCVICCDRYLPLSDLLFPVVICSVSTEVMYSGRETVLIEVVWK